MKREWFVVMFVILIAAAGIVADRAGDGGGDQGVPSGRDAAAGSANAGGGAEEGADGGVRDSNSTVDSDTETERTEAAERPGIPLMQVLERELGTGTRAPETLPDWLPSFAQRYDSEETPIELVRADLDGDGLPNEWVTVLYEESEQKDGSLRRVAHGVVIANISGPVSMVRHFAFPQDSFGRAKAELVGDLTGDGRPEIVWAWFNVGAHTTTSNYSVSSWKDGEIDTFEGAAEMANVSAVEILEGRLQLTGGIVSSAGAGPWQREYTDTYEVGEGKLLQRVDRDFDSAPTAYHRLLDGLWAEADEQWDAARAAFAEAEEMRDADYGEYAFEWDGEWIEGGEEPDLEETFNDVVREFALLRLSLVDHLQAGVGRQDACIAARGKTSFDESWLPYLNAPAGYANARWSLDTVCDPIDELER
ncbi:hypothetical protein MO973_26970 [Paenibacillus sp. TRM 82003]|nr:hypothetical protein [Paenibacillus sp. TRM 82003]